MKKIITTLLLLIVGTNVFWGENNTTPEDAEAKWIMMNKDRKYPTNRYERSLFSVTIDAILYPQQKEIEVSLYNIGDATIYVVDNYNRIIDSSMVNTESPITVRLSAGILSGIYSVIVSSETWYAEGCFTLE